MLCIVPSVYCAMLCIIMYKYKMMRDTNTTVPVHQAEQSLHTDMLSGVVIAVLRRVVADQEVERDDEPHGLHQGEDCPGHGHPALRLGDHLPSTEGGRSSIVLII